MPYMVAGDLINETAEEETVAGVERTEVKLGIEPGAHDDPITYHRLTK